MPRSRLGRTVSVLALLCVLFVLLVGFGTLDPDPRLGAYPTEDDFAADYDGYVGRPVQAAGTVVRTDPVVIAADYRYYAAGDVHAGTIDLTLTGVRTDVGRGEALRVFGVLRPDRTIDAGTVLTVPAVNFAYMYVVSALAGLWVFGRLVRDWRIDPRRGALTCRERPLDLVGVVLERVRRAVVE